MSTLLVAWSKEIECEEALVERIGYEEMPAKVVLKTALRRIVLDIGERDKTWLGGTVAAFLQMTPEQARALAALLMKAADEVEDEG